MVHSIHLAGSWCNMPSRKVDHLREADRARVAPERDEVLRAERRAGRLHRVAPNGIELHPLLRLNATSGCTHR
jgi:hypothetical protein